MFVRMFHLDKTTGLGASVRWSVQGLVVFCVSACFVFSCVLESAARSFPHRPGAFWNE